MTFIFLTCPLSASDNAPLFNSPFCFNLFRGTACLDALKFTKATLRLKSMNNVRYFLDSDLLCFCKRYGFSNIGCLKTGEVPYSSRVFNLADDFVKFRKCGFAYEETLQGNSIIAVAV